MLKKFIRNEEGNYAIIFTLMMVPIMGAVGMSVDFSNVSRLKYDLSESVDSAGIAVSKLYSAGEADRTKLEDLAKDFVKENFDEDYYSSTAIKVILPKDEGNTTNELIVRGTLTYKTLFGPVLAALTGTDKSKYVVVIEEATLKLRMLAEIALVLDNSGSMAWDKSGNTSGVAVSNQRITLLKEASKKLVTKMLVAGQQISQVNAPVKFSLIPFSASVNVGADNATKSWMDKRGVSPIHHEHLNWGTPSPTNPTGFRSVGADNAKIDAAGNPLTRFSILNALHWQAGGNQDTTKCVVWKNGVTTAGSSNSNCAVFRRSGTVTPVQVASAAAATAVGSGSYSQDWAKKKYTWMGCVEARPSGYDVTDEKPSSGNPASLFVPMFAPDAFMASKYGTSTVTDGYNNWWPDYETDADFRATDPAFVGNGYWASVTDTGQSTPTSTNLTTSSWWASTSRPREVDVAKYFVNKPYLSGAGGPTSSTSPKGQWQYFRDEPGPNLGCTTQPITPLTSDESDLHDAIDKMAATGNTNVPEGLAWGWRTVSHEEPFSEGVSETRKDMNKVVIVLTDGANTYSAISNGANNDVAGNESTYAAYGYSGYAGTGGTNGTATTSSGTNVARIFYGTTASKTGHDSDNFQKAMDQKMLQICANIKDKDVLLMTVALDLDPANYDTASEKAAVNKAIAALTSCAGESRIKKDASGNPVKLFWNAKSDTLDDTFDEIADELSNLRFTG
jgi:Flp pilus assembly protein TadG